MMHTKNMLLMAAAVVLAMSAAAVQAAPDTRHKRAAQRAGKTVKLSDSRKGEYDSRRKKDRAKKKRRHRDQRSRRHNKRGQVHTYPRRSTYYDYAYGKHRNYYGRGGRRYYGWLPKRGVHPYGNVVVVRPYSYGHHGYGRYYGDFAAYHFLAFSAITLRTFYYLSPSQRRAHDAAQVRATDVEIGETITWNDGTASGAVKVLREGDSSAGRYCREFQYTVTIAGKSEQAYGVACRQGDGAWEIISTR